MTFIEFVSTWHWTLEPQEWQAMMIVLVVVALITVFR